MGCIALNVIFGLISIFFGFSLYSLTSWVMFTIINIEIATGPFGFIPYFDKLLPICMTEIWRPIMIIVFSCSYIPMSYKDAPWYVYPTSILGIITLVIGFYFLIIDILSVAKCVSIKETSCAPGTKQPIQVTKEGAAHTVQETTA